MLSLRAGMTAALAATVLVSACSGRTRDDSAHSTLSDTPVVTGEPAGHAAADVTFSDTLIAHDQQGIDLAALVPSRSTNSNIVAFAATSASARRSEVTILKVMQVQWNSNQDDASGRQNQATTTGMVDPSTIGKLRSSQGGAFETRWLQAMIGLDNVSIDMANAEVTHGKNVDAVGVAKQIVEERQAELDTMKKMASA